MAIINCRKCDSQISDQVQNCPHCGQSLKPDFSPEMKRGFGRFVELFFEHIGGILYMIFIGWWWGFFDN